MDYQYLVLAAPLLYFAPMLATLHSSGRLFAAGVAGLAGIAIVDLLSLLLGRKQIEVLQAGWVILHIALLASLVATAEAILRVMRRQWESTLKDTIVTLGSRASRRPTIRSVKLRSTRDPGHAVVGLANYRALQLPLASTARSAFLVGLTVTTALVSTALAPYLAYTTIILSQAAETLSTRAYGVMLLALALPAGAVTGMNLGWWSEVLLAPSTNAYLAWTPLHLGGAIRHLASYITRLVSTPYLVTLLIAALLMPTSKAAEPGIVIPPLLGFAAAALLSGLWTGIVLGRNICKEVIGFTLNYLRTLTIAIFAPGLPVLLAGKPTFTTAVTITTLLIVSYLVYLILVKPLASYYGLNILESTSKHVEAALGATKSSQRGDRIKALCRPEPILPEENILKP